MDSFLSCTGLVFSGILLSECVPEGFTLESLATFIKGWIHNVTVPCEEITHVTSIESFWNKWSSEILTSFRYLVVSLLLLPIIFMMYESLEDNEIKEDNSKVYSDTTIPKELYDRMNSNERSFLNCLVPPSKIDSSFKGIGGLQNEVNMIKKCLLPIMELETVSNFNSALIQPPGGILLHGPPGCGKTLMAKSLAKESGINFMNVKSSDIKSCLYGKTEAKITALFSFAEKIQPVILFIDEIDSLLRSRGSESSNELSVTRGIKNLFMQHMDGLLNNGKKQVVIVGATNRKEDLDPAILRRMHPQIFIGLPNTEQRKEILYSILKNEQIHVQMDFLKLANETCGFSGSELRDVCKTAALNILEEVVTYSESQDATTKASMNTIKKEEIVICEGIMDELLSKIVPEKKRIYSVGLNSKYTVKMKNKVRKYVFNRPFRTEDILKVIAECKKNDIDDRHKFEMYK